MDLIEKLREMDMKVLEHCVDRKENFPREIAKYCFFPNMVRLNGSLNFLYLPKWRKGS